MRRSLEKLVLSGCSNLDELPSELGKMESLKVLHADGIVSSTTTPCYSTFWSWLSQRHGIEFSFPLTSPPHSLVHLSLANCNLSDDSINFSSLHSLKYLNLSGNLIYCLPKSINGLMKLESLLLDHCNMLQSLPELPTSLKVLSAEKCTSLKRIANLPNLMRSLSLNLTGCQQLVEVRDLFKLEPIGILDVEIGNKLGLFNWDFMENIKVEMFSVMTKTSRTAPPQVY